MASHVLYPPSIAPSLPAFFADTEVYRIPISFSKFNNTDEFVCAHVSITKKDTGMNVVNTQEGATDGLSNATHGHSRKTGIILNAPIKSITVDGETTYYIEIFKSDLATKSQLKNSEGWIPGWFYKIQVRLSSVWYSSFDSTGKAIGQQDWLNENASNFSEWSTVCIVKAIGDITIDVTNFDYKYMSAANTVTQKTQTYGNTLAFIGNFECEDSTETLAYHRLKLYKFPKEDYPTPLEDSGYIYNTAVNFNEFNYNFKTRLQDGSTQYVIEVEYNTLNNYSDTFRVNFTLAQVLLDDTDFELITLENDTFGFLADATSLGDEEENGRVGLKIYNADDTIYSGNLCIRRASSRDDFMVWEDIKIVTFKKQRVNDYDIIYDYTAESGVWYKYGIQTIKGENSRSRLNEIPAPIMRNYDYAYLLGENNQQLKLKFNNTMGSFKRNIYDAHVDTIGGKYAVFTRNSTMDYKEFPIEGLISFWMDEQNVFSDKKVIFGDKDIVEMYNDYNQSREITQYDYIYEREFRNLVSDFLHDGKPKLFKSTTEGNIIVRLTDVNMSPEEGLSRMIYSFSCEAYELDDNTVDNYKKYNLLDIGEVEQDLSTSELKIGQLYGEVGVEQNIFKLIREKYYQENLLGNTHKISQIKDLRIQFEGQPMRVINNVNKPVVGYNIELSNTERDLTPRRITLTGEKNYYEFEPEITFSPDTDRLYILGDAQGLVKKVNVIIDFLYEEKIAPYEPKRVSYELIHHGVGQVFGNYDAGTDFYKLMYAKYYYEWPHRFSKLVSLDAIEIEAPAGAAFELRDESDGDETEVHIMNATGTLYLTGISQIKGLRYLGLKEGARIKEINSDIIITYYYNSRQGGYQE